MPRLFYSLFQTATGSPKTRPRREAGQAILVLGAAGGVGSALTELAAPNSATVCAPYGCSQAWQKTGKFSVACASKKYAPR